MALGRGHPRGALGYCPSPATFRSLRGLSPMRSVPYEISGTVPYYVQRGVLRGRQVGKFPHLFLILAWWSDHGDNVGLAHLAYVRGVCPL